MVLQKLQPQVAVRGVLRPRLVTVSHQMGPHAKTHDKQTGGSAPRTGAIAAAYLRSVSVPLRTSTCSSISVHSCAHCFREQ